MYFRRKTSAGRAYLQIVESRRDGDQVRQQVIATLGRYEELQASGQLERLLRSGARFSAKAMVLSAAQERRRSRSPAGASGRRCCSSGCGRRPAVAKSSRSWQVRASTALRWSERYSSPCCTGYLSAAPTARRIAGARTTRSAALRG